MFELSMMDIFDKEPFDIKDTKPFTRFPPIFEGFIMKDIRGKFRDTKELVTVDDTIITKLHKKGRKKRNKKIT